MRVLIVEPDWRRRERLVVLVYGLGFDVRTSETASGAIHDIKEGDKYRVIVTMNPKPFYEERSDARLDGIVLIEGADKDFETFVAHAKSRLQQLSVPGYTLGELRARNTAKA